MKTWAHVTLIKIYTLVFISKWTVLALIAYKKIVKCVWKYSNYPLPYLNNSHFRNSFGRQMQNFGVVLQELDIYQF